MTPTGIQRTIAFFMLISPWIYIPSVFKEVFFIACAIFLFVSTLDLKKKQRANHYEDVESRVPLA